MLTYPYPWQCREPDPADPGAAEELREVGGQHLPQQLRLPADALPPGPLPSEEGTTEKVLMTGLEPSLRACSADLFHPVLARCWLGTRSA